MGGNQWLHSQTRFFVCFVSCVQHNKCKSLSNQTLTVAYLYSEIMKLPLIFLACISLVKGNNDIGGFIDYDDCTRVTSENPGDMFDMICPTNYIQVGQCWDWFDPDHHDCGGEAGLAITCCRQTTPGTNKNNCVILLLADIIIQYHNHVFVNSIPADRVNMTPRIFIYNVLLQK